MRSHLFRAMVFVLAASTIAFAQATGTINGRVVDQDGACSPASPST